MENETLEAKLRNRLSPLYSLVDMILLMEKKPEIKELLIEQAKQAVVNKEVINLLLVGIEAKTVDKPDVMRNAFDAGRERIAHPDWDFVYNDFDEYINQKG